MVKGNTRQVIVVKSPDPKLFDQAIFLLKEDALEKDGVGERELLEQARRMADGYLRQQTAAKPRRHLPPLFWMGMGAAPVCIAWLATILF